MSERKAGRPPLKDDSEKQDKKVMLSFTGQRYDELKKMQVLFNQATLTATILMFMDRGIESMQAELANIR
ncbi:MAG: hypothetical protein U9N59_04355 [Campylobacterota bacterium]|nr:hypothetical protein [Campylobacterota bacterium]